MEIKKIFKNIFFRQEANYDYTPIYRTVSRYDLRREFKKLHFSTKKNIYLQTKIAAEPEDLGGSPESDEHHHEHEHDDEEEEEEEGEGHHEEEEEEHHEEEGEHHEEEGGEEEEEEEEGHEHHHHHVSNLGMY